MNQFNYNWNLKDAIFTKDKGTVFSCFACGGGSTMGYKLAGFDVIGCNEIDPRMIWRYMINHRPKYPFLEGIQTFKDRNNLPKELYELTILDGSPPCSSFSMSGNRDDDWGKDKVFKEGQAKQVLDTLFFDFIELAKKLQPKIVVAENVKGLLMGSADKYVKKIYQEFDSAGYYCQHHLLDASNMGVPQRRERVFFIALRKDLMNNIGFSDMFGLTPKLTLIFNEPKIRYSEICEGEGRKLSDFQYELWLKKHDSDLNFGDINKREREGKISMFNYALIKQTDILPTLQGDERIIEFERPMFIPLTAIIKASSFPLDYNFYGMNPAYFCGMSVPPLMTANIATEIYNQWITKF